MATRLNETALDKYRDNVYWLWHDLLDVLDAMAPDEQDWINTLPHEERKHLEKPLLQPNQFCKTCWYWLLLMVVTSLTNDKLVCKNGVKTLRLSSSHITLKMSYSKCGLCLQDLEVIKPASGIRYIRCLNWKECPFFCPEENINGYQHCI